MKTWIKSALVIAIVFGIGGFVGGVIGFARGWGNGATVSGLGECVNQIVALRLFEAGKQKDAIRSMEQHIDRDIAILALSGDKKRHLLDVFNFGPTSVRASMGVITEYRKTHPIVDKEYRSLIESTLAEFGGTAATLRRQQTNQM